LGEQLPNGKGVHISLLLILGVICRIRQHTPRKDLGGRISHGNSKNIKEMLGFDSLIVKHTAYSKVSQAEVVGKLGIWGRLQKQIFGLEITVNNTNRVNSFIYRR